jgi:uncharacterized membrane protein (UPF0127 family)
MGSGRYCVYNQTNECFLSLGVAAASTAMERIRGMLEKRPPGNLEGYWLDRSSWIHVLAFFNARDLVYLDEGNKVMHVIESLPPRRFAHFRGQAASVLALPPGTVQSSQTQTGNQILVCEAEEMVFRLRATPKADAPAAAPVRVNRRPAGETPVVRTATAKERRISHRRRWPHLAAFDANGESLALHGVRDISSTGLYVITQERWPVGTHVRLSLQRTDGLDDSSMIPTTVELRVSRWGEDGVGLEFVKADPEHAALMSMHVR